jgi:hypothetical protein
MMAIRKDIKKNSDVLLGKAPKVDGRWKKSPSAEADKKKAADKKAKDDKNPVKKAVKEVKKVLPSKKVGEDRGEFTERQRSMPGGPQSREKYVATKKKLGQETKPRIEMKKGWGKNAPTKTRKMDE